MGPRLVVRMSVIRDLIPLRGSKMTPNTPLSMPFTIQFVRSVDPATEPNILVQLSLPTRGERAWGTSRSWNPKLVFAAGSNRMPNRTFRCPRRFSRHKPPLHRRTRTLVSELMTCFNPVPSTGVPRGRNPTSMGVGGAKPDAVEGTVRAHHGTGHLRRRGTRVNPTAWIADNDFLRVP